MFVAHWGSVFDPYVLNRPWFCVVEDVVGLSLAVASVAASSAGSCGTLPLFSIVVNLVFLLLVVTLRPYETLLDRIIAAVNALLNSVQGLLLIVPRSHENASAPLEAVVVTLLVVVNAVPITFQVAFALLNLVHTGSRPAPTVIDRHRGARTLEERLDKLVKSDAGRHRVLHELVLTVCEAVRRVN